MNQPFGLSYDEGSRAGVARGLDSTGEERASAKTALRQWIAGKLEAAVIEYFPLPHLIIENFFPDDVYRSIIGLNPFHITAGAEWDTRATRKEVHFPTGAATLGSAPHSSFWTALAEVFLGDYWFFDRIIDKFPEYFHVRYGPLVGASDFHSFFQEQMFVQRLDKTFFLGPHTDVARRVATAIFSFADRPGFEDYGTELCVPVDRLVRCSGRRHHERESFEVAKIAPYKPNNFLLFVRTSHSFHSVRPIDRDIPNSRYGMQYQLWERSEGIFRELPS